MPPQVQFAAPGPVSTNAQDETPHRPPADAKHDPDAQGEGSTRPQYRILSSMRPLRTAYSMRGESRGRHGNDTPGTASKGSNSAGRYTRFGDLSPYGINDNHEAQLWELEAKRLLDGLAETHVTLHVPETTSPSTLTHDINHDGFNQLERLSDQLLCALAICGLDDQIVLVRSNLSRAPADSAIIARSFWKLETRLKTDPQLSEMEQNRRRQRTSSRHPARKHGGKDGTNDTVKAVTDAEAPAYYAVVDYITLVLARLLSSAEPDSHWQSMVLTVLAKHSTKLKVLCHKLPTFGLDALLNNVETRDLLDFDADDLSYASKLIKMRQINRDDDLGTSEQKRLDAHVATHMSDMGEIATWLFRMLWRIMTDLATRDTRGRDIDEFDISVIVYATSSRNIPTMAYQDRHGYVSGSTSDVSLSLCHRAFLLLHGAAISMRDERQAKWNKMTHNEAKSTLTIETQSGGMKGLTLNMNTMTDIVSVMVALSCMDPSVIEPLRKVWSTVRAPTVVAELRNEAQGFTASAKLYNKLPNRQYGVPEQISGPQRSCPLSKCMLTQGNVGSETALRQRRHFSLDLGFDARQERAQYSSWMRNRIHTEARRWAVEENAVVVGCLWYTTSVLSICATLVIGGLCAGFLVGSRIDGVDPFNLTMFSWIIAGFIILLSKSVRVEEWSWRDFLIGRVRCKAVRELARVTGLDAQSVIMHLLSLEDELPIVTKGPYNSLFYRKDPGGFSIDVKPTIGTLINSGLLVLEVLTEFSPALVCLDLRTRADLATADSGTGGPRYLGSDELSWRIVHSQRRPVNIFACNNPPDDNEDSKDVIFKMQFIQWEKIIGIYNDIKREVY